MQQKNRTSRRTLVFGICVFLAAIVWLAFGRTLGCGFVNYDDPLTVSEVAEVTRGLSAEGVAWAFTHTVIGHWDPLTTLSHMVDCQIYGLKPWGHHLTNVLLHAAGTILLFLALREMTGALWRSAFVAALFAIHPLRVESVAWITERKDVLSGVFFMLALGAYARYAHGPSARRYFPVALAFALGLLCKSMLVTLPFVLLLLDYWPLGRWAAATATQTRRAFPWPLLIEKIPLLLLSATSAGIQILAARDMMTPVEALPLPARLGGALVSYVAYLEKFVWPVNLAVFYPSPGTWPLAQVLPAAALLLGLSILAVVLRRKHPYVLVGWLWFLGMLVPVIGIIQVGTQALADRYTYLPQIGLALAAAWAAADLSASWRRRRLLLGGAAGVVIAGFIFVARSQITYWHDSQTLWTHALACTERNGVAHNNLGAVLLQEGRIDAAIVQFQAGLENEPDYASGHFNLGNALVKKGRTDDAIAQYETALAIRPRHAAAHYSLGNALLKKGRLDDAIAQYQAALEINPDDAVCHYNLGNTLLRTGQVDDAISHFQRALQIQPDYPEAEMDLGSALRAKGELEAAIVDFQKALALRPDYAEAHYNLGTALLKKGEVGAAIFHFETAIALDAHFFQAQNILAWVLATSSNASLRDGTKAVELATQANQLSGGNNANILRTLAAACAERGQFPGAMAAVRQALQLAAAQGNAALATELRNEMALYEAGSPLHIAPGR